MPRTLYLIDGHAQIFRAYYAIRGGMTSPVTGEATQAVFGFAGMLLKLFEQFRPEYVAMAIDMPGKTFRDELYPEYKANRQPPPEDFFTQEKRIFEMTRMFGIPILAQEGAEADDLIATAVRRVLNDPSCRDVQIRVVSKDKDLEQLLCDRVCLFDIHTDSTVDVACLKRDKGITPQQVVDVLALMGDKVDNIMGVDGVGPKTAAKLIEEFGSIDGLLSNIEKVKGKRRENIEKAAAILPLNRQLVRLKDDLVFDFTLDAARAGAVDAEALRRFFREMGFRRHVSDLDKLLQAPPEDAQPLLAGRPAPPPADAPASPAPAESNATGFPASLFDVGAMTVAEGAAPVDRREGLTTAAEYDYHAVTTRDELEALCGEMRGQPIVSIDTETVGLGHRARLCGLCFSWQAGHGVYIPMCSPQPESHLEPQAVLECVRPVLEDPAVGKVGHNLKYDLLVLRHAGVELRGIRFDSMIAAFLVDAPGRSLDDLALALLKHETIRIDALIGPRERGSQQKTMDQVPLELITRYAAEDADIALRLYELLWPQIKAMGMQRLAEDVEMPLVEVLADMEHAGIRVDPQVLAQQKAALAGRIIDIRDRIHDLAGDPFNIDSPRQLADVLFKKMKLPVIKRSKTGPSTDIEVLERLAEMENLPEDQARLPRLIVEYRQMTKLVNTYLDALGDCIHPDTCRIHASFHQTGAATGRLSSSGPNLQNIPIRTDLGRQVRKAFIADPGHRLISADYSQIELRMLAHLSRDDALVEAFSRDMDIHRAVAAQVFGVTPDQVTSQQRAQAKIINFGIIYGVTAFGLARRIEGLDQKAAQELITSYRSQFPGIDKFLGQCIDQAQRLGYVTTILDRRRTIPQIESRVPQTRALGERLAINTVVQGSAADLIKLAMVNLHRRIARESLPMKLLLQIHDELVMEAPEAAAHDMAAIVVQEMEGAMALRVPLKVESGIGADWLAAK
jgi:DNA polymerase-1